MNQRLQSIQKEIAAKVGIVDEPTEAQQELIAKMNETLLQKIFVLTMQKLSKDDQEILMQKVEDADTSEDDINTFLTEAIQGYDAFVEETVEAFFTEMNEFIGDQSA